jgi:hypothetical protein
MYTFDPIDNEVQIPTRHHMQVDANARSQVGM